MDEQIIIDDSMPVLSGTIRKAGMDGRDKASQHRTMSIDAETVTLGGKDLMSREDGASDKVTSINWETS